MSNIFFTSDTHFGHDREFIYKPRGFNTIWEHDKEIIKRWNSIIQPEDEIFHLGDVMLGNNDYGLSCLKQLKGNIHIVRGNHCTDVRMELYNNCYNIVEITEGQFFKYNGYHFYLNHYPSITSNYDDDKPLKKKMVSLCGHRHDHNKFCDMNKGLIYHVEMDAHNCYPVLIDNIIQDIQYFISLDKYDQEKLCKNHI